MRLTEDIIIDGEFWPFGHPEQALIGTLVIRDNEPLHVNLKGQFNDESETFREKHFKIVGHIQKYGSVILEDCFVSSVSNVWDIFVNTKIVVNTAYLGEVDKGAEGVLITSLNFSCDYLDEWVGTSGASVERDEEGEITLTYKRPESIVITLDEHITLLIWFAFSTPDSRSPSEYTFRQKTYLRLVSNKAVHYDSLRSIASNLASLVSIATNNNVVISNISCTQAGYLNEKNVFTCEPRDHIDVYYQSIHHVPIKSMTLKEMNFSLNDIRHNLSFYIKNWLAAYDNLSPPISLYLSSRAGNHKFLESRFLSLVQGLESYHRRRYDVKRWSEEEFKLIRAHILDSCPEEYRQWLTTRVMHGNEVSLTKRLRMLIEPFGFLAHKNLSHSKLSQNIADTRNYHTHYDASLKDKAAQGRELVKLTYFLESIFTLQLLMVIGLSRDEIKNIVMRPFNPIKLHIEFALDIQLVV